MLLPPGRAFNLDLQPTHPHRGLRLAVSEAVQLHSMSQRVPQYAVPPRYGGSRSSRLRPQTADPRIPPPPLLPQILTDFVNELPPPNLWASSLLSYFIIDPLIGLTRLIIDIVVSPRTHRFVLRIGVLSAIFWTAFALAIISYVGFYRAWVPDIGIENQVWLQYGHDRPPFADLDLTTADGYRSVFAEDQKYDVSLDLVVPLSAANIDLGNFMVSLELYSPLNNTVHYASKPTIIIHESLPIRTMNNIAFQLTRNAPAILMPSSSLPVQHITIPLLRKAILQPNNAGRPFSRSEAKSVVKAHVSVGRQDSLKYWMYGGGHGVGGVMKESGGILKAAAGGEGFRSRGELQTHSASLRFDAHLTGLRYFMYHHPVASFWFFTTLFMFFELVSALTLWAVAALYTSNLTQPSLAVEDNYTGGMYGTSSESDTTMRGARRPGQGREDQGEESESITMTEPESEGEGNAQTQSLASLQVRNVQEQYEARRAQELRNEAEGRRMTGVDEPIRGSGLDELDLMTQGRRVLGRLDEETEEETDIARSEGRSEARSEGSVGWEQVGDAEMQQEEDDGDEEEAGPSSGLRRRRGGGDASQRETTVGGSSTSRASSSARSLAPTSYGGSTTRAPSSTAPSTVVSRSQTEATPEVKQEGEEEDEFTPEPETESSDEQS